MQRSPLRRGRMVRRYVNSGPDAVTRACVLWRDGHRCVRCGVWLPGQPHHIHHRRPRGMGGSDRTDTNAAANLISLCLGCHAHVESNRAEALANGWLVPQSADPAKVACLVGHGSRWVYLGLDVGYHDNPPGGAA